MKSQIHLWMEKLATLDLSRYEAAVYLALLQQGEATVLELADLSGVPRQRVYDVLDSLANKGLCQRKGDRPRRHAAIDPEVGLAALLEQRVRRQRAENERYARLIEELVDELQAVYGNGWTDAPPAESTITRSVGASRLVGGL